MPVLSIAGDKANGDALGKQVKLVASNAAAIILLDTGALIMEERPHETMDALIRFLGTRPPSTSPASLLPQMRSTPTEVRTNQSGFEQIGSPFLPASARRCCLVIRRERLLHDHVVRACAHDDPGHSHSDDRMANVVSGTWQFGYGDRFEKLRAEVSGFGPTDTPYVDSVNTPKTPAR